MLDLTDYTISELFKIRDDIASLKKHGITADFIDKLDCMITAELERRADGC